MKDASRKSDKRLTTRMDAQGERARGGEGAGSKK